MENRYLNVPGVADDYFTLQNILFIHLLALALADAA